MKLNQSITTSFPLTSPCLWPPFSQLSWPPSRKSWLDDFWPAQSMQLLPSPNRPLTLNPSQKPKYSLNAVCFKLHGRATLWETECAEQHFVSSSNHRKPSTGLQSKHFCNLLEFGTPWPLTLSSTCGCNEPEEIVCGVLHGDLISMCGCDVVLVRVWLKIVGLLSHQQTSVL